MAEVRICFLVHGVAEDENGAPAPIGACLSLGETGVKFDYQELVSGVNKAELLRLACLDHIATPDDVEFILPEEYDRDYGEEADHEDPR